MMLTRKFNTLKAVFRYFIIGWIVTLDQVYFVIKVHYFVNQYTAYTIIENTMRNAISKGWKQTHQWTCHASLQHVELRR